MIADVISSMPVRRVPAQVLELPGPEHRVHLSLSAHLGDDAGAKGVGLSAGRSRCWREVPRADGATRFLQLVESRLSQLESDVRFLKNQPGRSGSVACEPIMGDRRDSVSTYPFSISAAEPDSEDYGLSPDATDGMGSIEFTKEDDSGYYGISALRRNEEKTKRRLAASG